MMDESPVRWDRAIQVVEGVYPKADNRKQCAVARREGFEEGKRAIIAALHAAQAREWDRQLIKKNDGHRCDGFV